MSMVTEEKAPLLEAIPKPTIKERIKKAFNCKTDWQLYTQLFFMVLITSIAIEAYTYEIPKAMEAKTCYVWYVGLKNDSPFYAPMNIISNRLEGSGYRITESGLIIKDNSTPILSPYSSDSSIHLNLTK